MDVAIHWQDADSSSAKAVREIYPKAEIMLCGGHAGRAHRKILEKRQKDKTLPLKHVDKISQSYVKRSIRVVSVWCITAVDAAVLVTPLYPKHTPISLLF